MGHCRQRRSAGVAFQTTQPHPPSSNQIPTLVPRSTCVHPVQRRLADTANQGTIRLRAKLMNRRVRRGTVPRNENKPTLGRLPPTTPRWRQCDASTRHNRSKEKSAPRAPPRPSLPEGWVHPPNPTVMKSVDPVAARNGQRNRAGRGSCPLGSKKRCLRCCTASEDPMITFTDLRALTIAIPAKTSTGPS